MYGKYLVVIYRAMSIQSWGIKLVKKPTYYGVTGKTFIESLME